MFDVFDLNLFAQFFGEKVRFKTNQGFYPSLGPKLNMRLKMCFNEYFLNFPRLPYSVLPQFCPKFVFWPKSTHRISHGVA